MRAFLIDPDQLTVDQIEFEYSGIQDLYRVLGCDTFQVATSLENEDALYVDEEGLLKNSKCFFHFSGTQPLAGKGLLAGTDDNGDHS